jgi:hypothetical protein
VWGWIEGGERFGFAFEARQPFGVAGERLGQNLQRNGTIQHVSRARYTSPMAPAPILAMISYGPRRAPGVKAKARRFYSSRSPH